MSEGRRYRASWRDERPAEPDLELLAIEERFVSERAAGRNPRLADYIAAYPRHAAALAAFAADLDAADDAPPEAGDAALSVGTRRALDLIFADVAEEDEAPLRVAEAPAAYAVHFPRLVDLARERGLTAEALAEALGLTPGLVRWLDAAPLAPGDVPAALVARLAEALGVSEEAVWAALGGGDAGVALTSGPTGFRSALFADAALPADARAQWLATLDEAGE